MAANGRELLDDVLGRPDRLVRPVPSRRRCGSNAAWNSALGLRAVVADEHRPDAGRPLDLGRVAPDRLAVLEEDRLLARTASTPPPTLFMSAYRATSLRVTFSPPPPMRSAGAPGPAAGQVARVLASGVVGPGRRRLSPSSMPRMTGSASPSQRSRSGSPSPNSRPKASCSSSNQAAPMPRIARPPLMWSSVVAILAVRAGVAERVRADHEPDPDALGGQRPGRPASASPRRIGPSQSPTIG